MHIVSSVWNRGQKRIGHASCRPWKAIQISPSHRCGAASIDFLPLKDSFQLTHDGAQSEDTNLLRLSELSMKKCNKMA